MTDPDRMWIVGMPDELIATIAELSVAQRWAASMGWSASGINARLRYCHYISQGRIHWTRKVRSIAVARRLVKTGRDGAT